MRTWLVAAVTAAWTASSTIGCSKGSENTQQQDRGSKQQVITPENSRENTQPGQGNAPTNEESTTTRASNSECDPARLPAGAVGCEKALWAFLEGDVFEKGKPVVTPAAAERERVEFTAKGAGGVEAHYAFVRDHEGFVYEATLVQEVRLQARTEETTPTTVTATASVLKLIPDTDLGGEILNWILTEGFARATEHSSNEEKTFGSIRITVSAGATEDAAIATVKLQRT
jgi:hypothetical protein